MACEQVAELNHMIVKSIKDWGYKFYWMSKSSFDYLNNIRLATLGMKRIINNDNMLEYCNNNNMIIKRCLNE